MKRKVTQFFMMITVTMSLAVTLPQSMAQRNSNTAKGEIKKSGSEASDAARGMGRNLKHGRVVRGGKHFGKHIRRSGKHFGRSTKHAVKHAIS